MTGNRPSGDAASIAGYGAGAGIDDAATAAPAVNLRARSSSGVVWGFVDGVLQQILSLLIFVVLGRILSPAVFGVVSTAMVFVFLMRSTILNAMSTSLVALPKPTDTDYNTAFWLLIMISTGAVILLNIAAGPLARLYHIPMFEPVIRATSVIVLLFGFSHSHIGWCRRNFRFKALALRSVAGVLAGGIVGVGIALAGYGITALVVNQVLNAVVALVLLWLAVPWKPALVYSKASAQALMHVALPLGFAQGLQFLVQNFDTILVTYLLGPFAGGLYAAAKRITLAAQLAIGQPIAAVSQPVLSELAGDSARFARVVVKIAGLVMAVTAPAFIAVAVVSDDLVRVLFGSQWEAAAPILAILSLGGLAVPNGTLLNQIVLATGRARALLWLTLLQTAMAVGAIWASGADTAVSVALCLTGPLFAIYGLTLVYVRWLTAFHLLQYLDAILRPLAAAALMAFVMLSLPHVGWPFVQLCLSLSVGGISYAAIMFVISRSTFMEMVEFLNKLLPHRLRRGRHSLS